MLIKAGVLKFEQKYQEMPQIESQMFADAIQKNLKLSKPFDQL